MVIIPFVRIVLYARHKFAIVIFRTFAKTTLITPKEDPMPKDGQIDKKQVRRKKANGQTSLSRENQNQNRNAKKHSIPNNDV